MQERSRRRERYECRGAAPAPPLRLYFRLQRRRQIFNTLLSSIWLLHCSGTMSTVPKLFQRQTGNRAAANAISRER